MGGGMGGLGGGDDLGGIEGGDLGAEGGEAGAPPEGEAGAAPEAAPPEDGLPEGLYGLDQSANRRLINEMAKTRDRNRRRKIMESWTKRQNKEVFKDEEQSFNNAYEYMLNTKEFDGLTREKYMNDGLDIHDPSRSESCLVRWSVDEGERNDAIKENYDVLMENVSKPEAEEGDITDDDLPAIVG
jgi:hypothetical protein